MTTLMTTSPGDAGGKTEVLVNDLKTVAGDAGDLLKATAGTTADKLLSARQRMEESLRQAKDGLDSARLAVAEKAKSTAGATDEYVRENPWKVAGLAAVAGLLLGVIIRRW